MGSRDYRHKEPKKSKKDARKIAPIIVEKPSAEVQVIKKGKKEGEEEK